MLCELRNPFALSLSPVRARALLDPIHIFRTTGCECTNICDRYSSGKVCVVFFFFHVDIALVIIPGWFFCVYYLCLSRALDRTGFLTTLSHIVMVVYVQLVVVVVVEQVYVMTQKGSRNGRSRI